MFNHAVEAEAEELGKFIYKYFDDHDTDFNIWRDSEFDVSYKVVQLLLDKRISDEMIFNFRQVINPQE